MIPETFIFVGQSGCGKGTQADLLKQKLVEKYPNDPIFHLETGQNFRNFIAEDGYSNKLAKLISDKGDIQPSFLAVYFWADILLNNIKENEHVIFDGICRRLEEAEVFTTAMQFYGRRPFIIYINVSREWSLDRLLSRGRVDDKNREQLTGRLNWFEKYSLPVVEYFRQNNNYTFIEISGEQSIEDVHKEIVQKLGW